MTGRSLSSAVCRQELDEAGPLPGRQLDDERQATAAEVDSGQAGNRLPEQVRMTQAAVGEQGQAGRDLDLEDLGHRSLEQRRVGPVDGWLGIGAMEGGEHRVRSYGIARGGQWANGRPVGCHAPPCPPYTPLTRAGTGPDRAAYPRPEMKTILVVDDERNIVELLRLYLEKEGWAVLAASDGEEGLVLHARHDPDLVILDLMLPKVDGFEVCRELRRRGDVPIVMLTARDDVVDSIVGLELGADDYVAKPFNPRALVARIKAIFRRTEATGRGGRPIEVGDLRIDPRRREATVGARRLELRAREFDLLAALARDAGIVLTRDALLEGVWGTDFPGETRTVDVHVAEVRKKLGDDGPAIETIRGLGYRLVPPAREPIPG